MAGKRWELPGRSREKTLGSEIGAVGVGSKYNREERAGKVVWEQPMKGSRLESRGLAFILEGVESDMT